MGRVRRMVGSRGEGENIMEKGGNDIVSVMSHLSVT